MTDFKSMHKKYAPYVWWPVFPTKTNNFVGGCLHRFWTILDKILYSRANLIYNESYRLSVTMAELLWLYSSSSSLVPPIRLLWFALWLLWVRLCSHICHAFCIKCKPQCSAVAQLTLDRPPSLLMGFLISVLLIEIIALLTEPLAQIALIKNTYFFCRKIFGVHSLSWPHIAEEQK